MAEALAQRVAGVSRNEGTDFLNKLEKPNGRYGLIRNRIIAVDTGRRGVPPGGFRIGFLAPSLRFPKHIN
jgi:hypothetical protein